MSRDSVFNTFLVAFILCIVCSVLVSTSAVGLRPLQEENKKLEKQKNILMAAGLYDPADPPKESIDSIFKEKVTARLVDLKSGEYVDPEEIDVESLEDFDQMAAADDPEQSIVIPDTDDIADIKRREKYSIVYLIDAEGDDFKEIVLPVYGKGLWSTMYGFLALKGDLDTVAGLSFYQHGETPGLGGEIDNPSWKKKWIGKKLYTDDGELAIAVTKQATGDSQVDALSGATITSRGVSNLLHYWLGENAYGPMLKRLDGGESGSSSEETASANPSRSGGIHG
ncbi:Na(+)-translocating NADH-quinone reductase subunit C [Planctomycetales bacterium 10988]|nr:Na(+)-translocating NADH-quinone reductase subunit C [Planctomycetales bacterium 10988]